jgi:hypothetical protein
LEYHVTDDTNPRERVRLAALDAAEKLRALAEFRARTIGALEKPRNGAETIALKVVTDARPALVSTLAAAITSLRDLAIRLETSNGVEPPSIRAPVILMALDLAVGGASDEIRWARMLEVYAKSLRPRGRPKLPPGTPKAEDEPVRAICVTPTQREWLRAQPGGTTATLRRLIDALAPSSFPAAKWYEAAEEAADVTTGARLDGHETRLHDLARQAGVGPWELLRAAIERERAGKPARGGTSKKKNGRA